MDEGVGGGLRHGWVDDGDGEVRREEGGILLAFVFLVHFGRGL